MAIKDIVVHQGPDPRSQARLDVAVGLAKAHEARVVGLFTKVVPGAPEFRWVAFGREGMAKLRSEIEAATARAEEAFKSRMAEEGLASDWRVAEGSPTDAIVICSRFCDLTVIGQTNPALSVYEASMPDEVVLGAGGPVLVVPHAGKFEAVGRRVMVAWNGTRESSRAARDAMPLLQRAEEVIVCSVKPTNDHQVSGKDLCAHLARHGVSAEAGQILRYAEIEAVRPSSMSGGDMGIKEPGNRSGIRRPTIGEIAVGDALLTAVTEHSMDLLVMGAYGHSRFRELVLGGATHSLLQTMTVPVVFSN